MNVYFDALRHQIKERESSTDLGWRRVSFDLLPHEDKHDALIRPNVLYRYVCIAP